MSGGSLNYFYSRLEEHCNDLGDRELNELVKDLAELFHDREWFLSGDTGEGDWNESRDDFKKKWFTREGHNEVIIKIMNDIQNEVYTSFGISSRYCKNCKYFIPGTNETSSYGDCPFNKYCRVHTHDTCDKWYIRGDEE